MSYIDLQVIPAEKIDSEELSLKPGPKQIQPKYEAEKKEVSENIRKFDWAIKHRPKVYTENPFSHAAVVKKLAPLPQVKNPEQMKMDPTYNTIAKFLGVDTIHDWNKNNGKIFEIVEWAKKKSGYVDALKLMKWISNMKNRVPSIGQSVMDDLYLYAHLQRKNG